MKVAILGARVRGRATSRRGLAALLMCLSVFPACVTYAPPPSAESRLTEADIALGGTRYYRAPVDAVFDATVGALKAQGFDIAVADRSRGLVVTNRRLLEEVQHTRGALANDGFDSYGVETETRSDRGFAQYYVEVRATPSRGVIVVARPRYFLNERDATDGPLLADGQYGFRTHWRRLFRQIDMLVAP